MDVFRSCVLLVHHWELDDFGQLHGLQRKVIGAESFIHKLIRSRGLAAQRLETEATKGLGIQSFYKRFLDRRISD